MTNIGLYRDNPTGLFGLQRLNRLLDEAFGRWPPSEQSNAITSAWFAPTDVSEDTEGLRVRMELPGVTPEDVKISLEDNVLTIRGEKRQQAEERNERVHRYERSYGFFERSFALPSTVDPDKVTASYENGVVTITIPKSERARPREIPVTAQTRPESKGRGEIPVTSESRGSREKASTKSQG